MVVHMKELIFRSINDQRPLQVHNRNLLSDMVVLLNYI